MSDLTLAGVRLERGGFTLEASLAVAPGEIVALVGANGAGKTSLLHAVAGLLAPAAGEITLGGMVLDGAATRLPPERRGVGLVPQQHVLFGHLSALENAAFALRARGVRRAQARREALAELTRLGVADRAGVRARDLSGGQAQRVALARAVCARPRALLLDEPFAALDAGSRGEIAEAVRRLVDDLAVPCLLVSHDAGEVARLADAVVPVAGGRARR
ncbi:ABC transporter ATP-binding protein [Serinibacter salmoneus]|uniref:Molybdate transport system ATP-binding protein/molybdate transport system permease protein n=1 Tax=Serinibacter salmoneus TaxID=556530 RepID=A0A2A9D2T4_9MICO|nr:ATP-binding cassette domain-containing protein [Serinibacter salmoneus]PFG21018.1 molybdate transport system ATP-binding protein/molybdate transport system permease protein [Serinibacter salmoneus]